MVPDAKVDVRVFFAAFDLGEVRPAHEAQPVVAGDQDHVPVVLDEVLPVVGGVGGPAPAVGAAVEEDHDRLGFIAVFSAFRFPDVQGEAVFALLVGRGGLGGPLVLEGRISVLVAFDLVVALFGSFRSFPAKIPDGRLGVGNALEEGDPVLRGAKHDAVVALDLDRIVHFDVFLFHSNDFRCLFLGILVSFFGTGAAAGEGKAQGQSHAQKKSDPQSFVHVSLLSKNRKFYVTTV